METLTLPPLTKPKNKTKVERLLAGPSNSKLGAAISSWSIPAVATCPGATETCQALCYVLKGHFRLGSIQARYRRNYERSKQADFVRSVVREIRRGELRTVRIHVSGDFYDAEYLEKWAAIVQTCPQTTFFGYTRSWRVSELMPELARLALLPNMWLWLSEDRDCVGQAPELARTRVAMLVQRKADEALVDPARHDLVFRDRRHRSLEESGPGPLKRIAGVAVCPAEQWIIWSASMTMHREPPKITCSQCRICCVARRSTRVPGAV